MTEFKHSVWVEGKLYEGDGISMENGVLTVFNREPAGGYTPAFQFRMARPGTYGKFGITVAQPKGEPAVLDLVPEEERQQVTTVQGVDPTQVRTPTGVLMSGQAPVNDIPQDSPTMDESVNGRVVHPVGSPEREIGRHLREDVTVQAGLGASIGGQIVS